MRRKGDGRGSRPAWLLLGLAAGRLAGAAEAPPGPVAETAPAGPLAVVLGSVQDGGLPHAGCTRPCCRAAREDPARRRHVASLAIVSGEGGVWLIDATPDLTAQLAMLEPWRKVVPGRVDREPVSGVLLTHAHIGHYLGLAYFGFETLASRDLPVLASPAMAEFLRHNAPWKLLVERCHVSLEEIPMGRPFRLARDLEVTTFRVPHRDEYADTVAYRVRGPRRTLLYAPDTDTWDTWDPSLAQRLEGVDLALLDGTFYSLDELPGRDVRRIGHPLVTRTMELLEERVRSGKLAVYFTHLNHSNPANRADSAELAAIRARGFDVVREGQRLGL